MSIWQRLRRWWVGSQRKKKYHFVLGEPNSLRLTYLATRENRILAELESQAVSPPNEDPINDELYRLWNKLSAREQEVTAYVCLKYTNRQIAGRLGLSPQTVRTYLDKAIQKLKLDNKADLRVVFANWDFSEWERRKTPR